MKMFGLPFSRKTIWIIEDLIYRLFSGGVETACGMQPLIQVLSTAQQTKSVYGFVFFEELKTRFGAQGGTLLPPMWLHMRASCTNLARNIW
jgi:hypothetical protein